MGSKKKVTDTANQVYSYYELQKKIAEELLQHCQSRTKDLSARTRTLVIMRSINSLYVTVFGAQMKFINEEIERAENNGQ